MLGQVLHLLDKGVAKVLCALDGGDGPGVESRGDACGLVVEVLKDRLDVVVGGEDALSVSADLALNAK